MTAKGRARLAVLMDALNDIDIIGGELSWRVRDLYTKQDITWRQRRSLIAIARRAQKVMDDLVKLRESMGLPERPE